MNNILVRLTAPFAIWFAHFSLVYGEHAALCSTGHSAHSTIIWPASIAAVLAIVALFAIPLRSAERRSDRAAIAVASGLALLAVIWTSVPAVLLKACA